jgi:hypothetical protein
MFEKVCSVCTGSVTAFVSSLMIDKLLEVIILSFLGGVVGWFGGRAAKWMDKKFGCLFQQIKTKRNG